MSPAPACQVCPEDPPAVICTLLEDSTCPVPERGGASLSRPPPLIPERALFPETGTLSLEKSGAQVRNGQTGEFQWREASCLLGSWATQSPALLSSLSPSQLHPHLPHPNFRSRRGTSSPTVWDRCEERAGFDCLIPVGAGGWQCDGFVVLLIGTLITLFCRKCCSV